MALKDNWVSAGMYFAILSMLSLGVSYILSILNPTGFIMEITLTGEFTRISSDAPRWAWALSWAVTAAFAIISPVWSVGAYAMVNAMLGGEKASPRRGFDMFPLIFRAFLINLIRGALTILGLIAFIVPGVIIALCYSMSDYLLARNPDLGVLDALRQSRRLMRARKGRLLCLSLSFIGWALLMSAGAGVLANFMALPFGGGNAASYIQPLLTLVPLALLNAYIYTSRAAFYADAERGGQLY